MGESDFLLNRREMMGWGISAGFALAVSPAIAMAVTTSEDGLVTESVKVPVGTVEMPAYVARPKGKGPFPIVIVIHEIFGVHAYIQDVCRRLAKQGYFAVAPYLFFRQGDVTQMKDTDKIVSEVVSKVDAQESLTDLDALLAWAKGQKAANLDRAAITGFCWGGTIVWRYVAHNPKMKAGVAWYGRLVNPNPESKDKFPLDLAAELKVPVLGLYGGKDKGIPVTDVEKMRAKLKEGTSGSEIIVYPEAGHAFHADYRPSYHESSAAAGWKKLSAWLKQHKV